MRILVTNDDGYDAEGLKALVEILRPMGELLIVAPKYHQSGMSMAVTMGLKPIAVKKVCEKPGETWYYLDGTPASCVKFALGQLCPDCKPDLVVSGINHGSNAGTAVCYSGTLGAAQEAALADVPAVGVSLANMSMRAGFDVVKKFFPEVLKQILATMSGKFGVVYNVNFPDIPCEQIKGVRTTHQGIQHWIREFAPYDMKYFQAFHTTPEAMGVTFPRVEEGEEVYIMLGEMVGDERNTPGADYLLNNEGYITITVHNTDSTDYSELERLKAAGIDKDFR